MKVSNTKKLRVQLPFNFPSPFQFSHLKSIPSTISQDFTGYHNNPHLTSTSTCPPLGAQKGAHLKIQSQPRTNVNNQTKNNLPQANLPQPPAKPIKTEPQQLFTCIKRALSTTSTDRLHYVTFPSPARIYSTNPLTNG